MCSRPSWRTEATASRTGYQVLSYDKKYPDIGRFSANEEGRQEQVRISLVQLTYSIVCYGRAGHSMDWTDYHPIEDMHSYFDYLETNYDFVTTESIGKSYEGSDMRIAKVCKGGCGNKPAMWFDGGIHAREWISPATVMHMLMEIVENDADHSDLTENLDW